MITKLKPLFLVFILLLSGCETVPVDPRLLGSGMTVIVKVSSVATDDAREFMAGRTWFITSGMRDVGAEDLDFHQAARYVSNGLKDLGYLPASSADTADFIVKISYGIGNPQQVDAGNGYSYWTSWGWNYIPSQKYASYHRNLIVEGFEQATKKPLFKTTATSDGTSGNILRVLPYMIAPSHYFYGANKTGQEFKYRISGHDPVVIKILQ